jgi:hypothetical protein
VRRIAYLVLVGSAALALLFTSSAWAPQITLTIRNNSSHDVRIVVFQPNPNSLQRHEVPFRVHHEVDPNESFHASGIRRESCVVVRVARDNGDPNARCQDNHTPLDVRCDVSSQYSCKVHRNEVDDIVVKVGQPGA